MKKRTLFLLVGALGLISCLTINIYFPAEEVQQVATDIVTETWGENSKPSANPVEGGDSSFIPLLFSPAEAHAQQNINVSTPAIAAIKTAMKQRAQLLKPQLDAGAIGIARDGMLSVRAESSIPLSSRAEIQRLVTQENDDRNRLYAEIARANGFPHQTEEVRKIFADTWRKEAQGGWLIQEANGNWRRK